MSIESLEQWKNMELNESFPSYWTLRWAEINGIHADDAQEAISYKKYLFNKFKDCKEITEDMIDSLVVEKYKTCKTLTERMLELSNKKGNGKFVEMKG
jgi:hypothetical protein